MFWLATLNLILIFLIYTPTLNGYFLAEDYAWWLYVKSKSFFEVLKYFVVPPSQALAGFYHPLIGLSYWLNVNFSWMKPFGFHLTNLLLHLSNYLLVVVLAYFFFKKIWPAILAGFFFVIFPFHSEAVAWIDGRHYLLPTFFYLLSFYLFLRWQENKKGSLLGFSVFTYLLALLAHEVTITLPLALTLCLIYTSEVVGNQHRVLVRLKHTVWYWVVLGGYLMLHGVYVGYFNPFRGASHLSTIVSRILVFYLIFLVFSMMFFFIVRKQKGWDKDHLGLVPFLAILIGVFYLPVAFFPTQERYLYLPSSIASIFLANLFFLFWQNKILARMKQAKTSMIFVLILLAGVSINYLTSRVYDWRGASEIAKRVIEDFKTYTKDIPGGSAIYFVNLPDNYHGSYIFRTHVEEAMEYGSGKNFKKIVWGERGEDLLHKKIKIV